MNCIAVIPARYESSRFPGKPLADISGKPMIQHVYERVVQAKSIARVIVATDDERVYQAVKGFGGEAVKTSIHHKTGTDRICEVVKDMDVDVVINIQGDEPLVQPEMLNLMIEPFVIDSSEKMVSLYTELMVKEELLDPNVVKVVMDRNSNALYFSRSPIPFVREEKNQEKIIHFKHMGFYAYQKKFLLEFINYPETYLESIEKLEQLRVLENGISIKMVKTDHDTIGVDIPEDVVRVEKQLTNNN